MLAAEGRRFVAGRLRALSEERWGFTKIGVPFLGVLIIRTIVYILGSILGSPYFGKLPDGGERSAGGLGSRA